MTQATEKALHEAQAAQKIVALEERTRKSTQVAKTLQEFILSFFKGFWGISYPKWFAPAQVEIKIFH